VQQVVAERGVLLHLQAGLFEAGKESAVQEQFRFECVPVGLGLSIIICIAQPAIANQRLGFFDACPASQTGVLTAAVGVDNQTRRWFV